MKWVDNGHDCDDLDWANTNAWAQDLDQDGHGNKEQIFCAKPPGDMPVVQNFVEYDCDDINPDIKSPTYYYADDGDGFGDPKLFWRLCPGEQLPDPDQPVVMKPNDASDVFPAKSSSENLASVDIFRLISNGQLEICRFVTSAYVCLPYAAINSFTSQFSQFPTFTGADVPASFQKVDSPPLRAGLLLELIGYGTTPPVRLQEASGEAWREMEEAAVSAGRQTQGPHVSRPRAPFRKTPSPPAWRVFQFQRRWRAGSIPCRGCGNLCKNTPSGPSPMFATNWKRPDCIGWLHPAPA